MHSVFEAKEEGILNVNRERCSYIAMDKDEGTCDRTGITTLSEMYSCSPALNAVSRRDTFSSGEKESVNKCAKRGVKSGRKPRMVKPSPGQRGALTRDGEDPARVGRHP